PCWSQLWRRSLGERQPLILVDAVGGNDSAQRASALQAWRIGRCRRLAGRSGSFPPVHAPLEHGPRSVGDARPQSSRRGSAPSRRCSSLCRARRTARLECDRSPDAIAVGSEPAPRSSRRISRGGRNTENGARGPAVAPLTRVMNRALFCAIAALTALMQSAAAQAEPTDTAVKAAFLPRFARYVTWPASAMPKGGDPFVLCVIGDDPFGGQLEDAARSQLIDGRRISVRRMDSVAGADSCQIAFVGGTHAAALLAALGNRPVLTVT